jgi:DNA-binding transcriptional LysR family regulator
MYDLRKCYKSACYHHERRYVLDALTLDQLRVLVAIADEGSFSAAARKLRRVQSAISQSVRLLEGTLDVQMFDRTAKYPVLTPQGAVLLADARRLLREADALRARARGMAQGLEAELALAVDPLFPNAVLMRALRDLERDYPTLPIKLVTAGITAPERLLREQAVTLAIYSLETTGAEDLNATFLVDIEMVPVVAAKHALAMVAGPLTRKELSEHVQLVLSNAGSSGWTRGVVSPKTWRFADLHARLEFLLEGFGWCNMPRHLVAPAIAAGRLVELHLPEPSGFRLALHAVQESARPAGPGGRALIEQIRQLLGSPQGG